MDLIEVVFSGTAYGELAVATNSHPDNVKCVNSASSICDRFRSLRIFAIRIPISVKFTSMIPSPLYFISRKVQSLGAVKAL